MDRRRAYIGILILFVVIGVGFIYLYSWQTPYMKYVLYSTESVEGMVVTAPVQYHGVQVGEVVDISLNEERKVRILIKIAKAISINQGVKARIINRGLASSGFTGYVLIALEDLDYNRPLLTAELGQQYPVIPLLPSKQYNLDLAFSHLENDADNIAATLNSVLSKKTIHSLERVIENMDKITTMIEANNQRLNDLLIMTTKTRQQFTQFLESGTRTMMILETQLFPEIYQLAANFSGVAGTLSNVAVKIDKDPSIVIRGVKAVRPGPGEKG